MTAALEPALAEIPAGTFAMGDRWGDGEPDELPVVPRAVERFALGRYAVTNAQFVRFLNDTPAQRGFVAVGDRQPVVRAGDAYACAAEYADHPVTAVSWTGATAYCAWLSARTGRAVRLPTELEWEYAAGGERGSKWSGGDAFDRDAYVCAADGPQPADRGAPSAWGLYNLTGNVFEWCADTYRFSLAGEALPENRVIKGGAFILSDSANFRNAKRFSCHEQSCLASIGFRVAAEAR